MHGSRRPARTPLWREAVGSALRTERHRRARRLVDVAAAAGVSPQYLSELERGMKDPSSEMFEAVAGALGLGPDVLAVRAALLISAASRPRVLRSIGPRELSSLSAASTAPDGSDGTSASSISAAPAISETLASQPAPASAYLLAA